MPEPKLAPEQCTVREDLVESIKAVMEHLVMLHRHEMEAVRNWDIDAMERIDQDVDRANAHRDSLLDRLKSHVKGHGCLEPRMQTPVRA